MLEHDSLHLGGVGCAVLVEWINQFLDGIKVWSNSRKNQRIGTCSRHNRDLHGILCCRTRHCHSGLLQRGCKLVCVGKCQWMHANLLGISARNGRRYIKLRHQLVSHCNEGIRSADNQRASAAITRHFHLVLSARNLAPRTCGQDLLQKRTHLIGAATLQYIGLEASSWHALQLLDDSLYLREGSLITSDNECPACRFHLHRDFGALSSSNRGCSECTTLSQSANARGNLLWVAALNTPRTDTRLWWGLNPVKLRNYRLKLRLAVAWAFHDNRIGSRVSADEDVLLLLQVREWSTTCVKRHGWLWIELVERSSHFNSTTNAQRNNHRLALTFLFSTAIDAFHKLSDFRKHILVGSHDQRVGCRIGIHTNWLLAAHISGTLVVACSQQLRHLASVGCTNLQQTKRRELPWRDGIELPNHFLHGSKLRRFTNNPQRIRLFDRLNRWRGEWMRRIIHLRLGNKLAYGSGEF